MDAAPVAPRPPPPVAVLRSNNNIDHLRYLAAVSIDPPSMGLSPMEVCCIMGHWSSLPLSADPWGMPRNHLLPDGTSRLVAIDPALPFSLPPELSGLDRSSLPASFFRRSPTVARAYDAAVSLYLSLRGAPAALPLGLHLRRLMTIVSGVEIVPPGRPDGGRRLQLAERSLRPLSHRWARLYEARPVPAPSLGQAFSRDTAVGLAYLPDRDFAALLGRAIDVPVPEADAAGNGPLSDSDNDLPPSSVDRLLAALFRSELGLEDALSTEIPHHTATIRRVERLETAATFLLSWVRTCAALVESRAFADE